MGQPTRAPELHPPRGPPDLELDLAVEPGFDQTLAFNPAEPEPVPAFDIDETPAW
jgi:hypothetical protein